jgi:hypothetical protein
LIKFELIIMNLHLQLELEEDPEILGFPDSPSPFSGEAAPFEAYTASKRDSVTALTKVFETR